MILQCPYFQRKHIKNFINPALNYSNNLDFISFADLYANSGILQLENNQIQFQKNEDNKYSRIYFTHNRFGKC